MYEGAIEAALIIANKDAVVEEIIGNAIAYATEVANENHICITCEFIDADGDVAEAQEIVTAVMVNMINQISAAEMFCEYCRELTENDEAS